ncbi:unnamed protein product [Sphenostylis stenocarpa]|uniref:Transmembrane protein n=1 Tax=Sphenostylis stenocarpa TaxID=92480 RepID=A0AA86SG73_9FABA|nr:unnamed protein product [Sphenostylis stenocarpa]
MAWSSPCCISVPFLILLIVFLSFLPHLTPVSEDLKMRKLGTMPSPPPSPRFANPLIPGGHHPGPPLYIHLKMRKLGPVPSPPPPPRFGSPKQPE